MNKAVNVVINHFLKDVEEKGVMPWQEPYQRQAPYNYFTEKRYRGINRLMLPFGEYVTKKQMQHYNKENQTNFKERPGIEWFPIVYFTKQEKDVNKLEIQKLFPNLEWKGTIGNANGWLYKEKDGKFQKSRNILRFYWVADIKYFQNEKRECLPSKLKDIELTKTEPKAIMDAYVQRSGVGVKVSGGVPCYVPGLDEVHLNPFTPNEEEWYSTAFHELAHSTGHPNRLAREHGVSKLSDAYAKEECIAEICACLLCAESGITSMDTSCYRVYENSLAYVQYWKQRVRDWGSQFVYVVAQAEAAFNYVLGRNQDITET